MQKATAILTSLALFVCCLSSLQAEDKATDVKVKAITLKVPDSWEQQPPSNNLRLAEFKITGEKEDPETELVISSFGGTGGGVAANIERWVGQFNADGREVKVWEGKSTQGSYVLVDIQGTYNMPVGPPIQRKTTPVPNARMLSVILAVEGEGNYFLKLTGGEKTVASQLKAFRDSFGADADSEKAFEQ